MSGDAPSGVAETSAAPRRDWRSVSEVGSVLGIRILLAVALAVGRAPMRALLALVALYYVITHAEARRHSRAYLRRMGLPDGFGAVYRHVRCFATCVADRALLIAGRTRGFQIEGHGSELLEDLKRRRQGALLLGAHLGSFEVMHARSVRSELVVNVVGYFRNARLINGVLEDLGGGVHTRLIEAGGGIQAALQLRDRIARGELVAILADRNLGGRSVHVQFLGGTAALPTGPLSLAAALGCPVYLTFGLYRGGNRYDVYCEPFAERVLLPRVGRERALQEHVQRFAERLEHYCRMAPDNWFNFYDFWATQEGTEPAVAEASAA